MHNRQTTNSVSVLRVGPGHHKPHSDRSHYQVHVPENYALSGFLSITTVSISVAVTFICFISFSQLSFSLQ